MDRTMLISDIENSHAEFMSVINRVSPSAAEAPDLLGWWSARQMLAHLIGWQEKAIEVIEGLRDGHEVETPEEDDPFNAANVARLVDKTWPELKVRIEASSSKLIELARTLPEDVFDDPRAGWFVGSTINHYRIHQPDFERALLA